MTMASRVLEAVSPELLEYWQPWWRHEMRHLPTDEMAAELDYSEREILEARADPLIEDGYLDIESRLAGLLVRREMLTAELARRTRWSQPGEDRDGRRRLVDFAQDLKGRVPLYLYLAERHGLGLKRMGRAYEALCPFHVEKTPSFHCREASWHCFGCGDSGDIYDYLLKIGAADGFLAAVRIVAEYAGAAMPARPSGTRFAGRQIPTL